MSGEPVALLFMPPWEPIRLNSHKAVVIGRSPSCDLPVPSPRVSRRHAWVHREGADYQVSDLGSTNGTFVNEQRVIVGRILRAGDRIRVGDHAITYCVMEPGMDITPREPLRQGTVVFEGDPLADPSHPDALQGDLSHIPIDALLQMLEIGRKSGLLDVESPLGRARLWTRAGRPVHAELGTDSGLHAALEIVRLVAGRFSFAPCASIPEATISHSMPELLIEASRQTDESRR